MATVKDWLGQKTEASSSTVKTNQITDYGAKGYAGNSGGATDTNGNKLFLYTSNSANSGTYDKQTHANNMNDTYGNSGGGGGSGGSSSSGEYYKAARLPSATSQTDYINALYAAKLDSSKNALSSAYDENVATLDNSAEKIPAEYQAAANTQATQDAITRKNFNEYAAGVGYNSGAGSQARLAMDNQASANQNTIRTEQAKAMADIEFQRAQLAREYQNAIAQAIADNNAEKASALYEEAVRVDNSIVNTAVNQATENYRMWQTMYG